MKKGMSLAEVLICLAIIGIIVVLTIPNTIMNAQKQARLTQAKKAYNALSDVYEYAIYKDGNGNIIGDPAGVKGIDATTVHQITSLEDVAKVMFNENMRAGAVDCTTDPGKCTFRTDDGSVFTFSDFNLSCAYINNDALAPILDDSGTATAGACFTVLVDINGAANPNTLITSADINNKDYTDRYEFYGFKTEIKYLNDHAELFQNNK